MLVAPAILIALFVIVRRSGNSGFLPAGAFEGKNGRLNAIMSVLLILASIVMGYALYTSYELAGDDFGKFNGVDHSMLSEFMYYHTSGSFRESSLLAFGFIVSTLGILGGLLSAKSRKMAVVSAVYMIGTAFAFLMACL